MVVSGDEAGMIEYWSGLKGDCKFPQNIDFQYKTDTDLFDFVMVSTLGTFVSVNIVQEPPPPPAAFKNFISL